METDQLNLVTYLYRRLRGWFCPRQMPRPPCAVLPVLEGLEERCVMTVLADPTGTSWTVASSSQSFASSQQASILYQTSLSASPTFAAAGTTSFAMPANQTDMVLVATGSLGVVSSNGSASDEVSPSAPRITAQIYFDETAPASITPNVNPGQAPTGLSFSAGPQTAGLASSGFAGNGAAALAPEPEPGLSIKANGSAGPNSDPVTLPGSPGSSFTAGNGRQPASASFSAFLLPGTDSLSGKVNPANLPDSLTATVRFTRTPASTTTLEVPYTLSTYSSSGTTTYEGTATFSSGSDHADVLIDLAPAGKADRPEILILTLQASDDYQAAQNSLTLFLTGDASGCSDRALLEAYRQGKSEQAFRSLVERHRPLVLQTCYRILNSWSDAEDVSQMVFLSLARRPVQVTALLAGWLSTVARNAAIGCLRSRNRRSRHEQQATKPVEILAENDAYELREELDTALQKLPAPLREAVSLRYLEGLTQKEAAEVLGCPRGTLAQRVSHGVRCLRSILTNGSGKRR